MKRIIKRLFFLILVGVVGTIIISFIRDGTIDWIRMGSFLAFPVLALVVFLVLSLYKEEN